MSFGMKGAAKSKVVTSGRLTGGVKATRRRVTPNAGPAARPEPAYSLYSTDSEDQVTTLHKGLDRCAALLNDMLQVEKTEEASAGRPRALRSGAARSKPSTPLGKKFMKKPPTKTDQKSRQSVQRGAGSTAFKTVPVKLHPTQNQPATSIPPPEPKTSIPPPEPPISPPPPSPPSDPRPLPQTPPDTEAPHTHRDREEDEFIPVRDTRSPSPVHTCPPQPQPGESGNVPEDTHTGGDGGSEAEVRVKTVQYLLGELKALIAGQGSVAERLLSHLELSLPLTTAAGSNIQTEPDLHRENTQLRRRVRILNQQLKEREKAERQQNTETLCNSAVSALQEELTGAQLRLQELQDDLTELREALKDTRSQLTDREAQNAAMATELEAVRNRLLDSEREKSELASLAQQRLEEIENLNRIHQSPDPPVSDTEHLNPQQLRPGPVTPPTDRITQFLMTLEPTHTEHVREAAAERIKPASVELRDTLSHPEVKRHQNFNLNQVPPCVRRLSHCESVASDWSTRSGSTFNTRDEAAFRDGLAALDASIASLQKSIQLDLGR